MSEPRPIDRYERLKAEVEALKLVLGAHSVQIQALTELKDRD